MKETTDALELLISQHDEVDMLIEELENSDDADEKMEIFQELADKIAAHSTVEEKLFYPSVMAKTTCELLLESTEEHLSVKRVLADLLEMDPDNDHFDAKVSVLKDLIHHHAREEEEAELFPKVRKLMSEDELAGLGNEMLAMFEMLLERQPRMNVPAETSEAAPLEMNF